MRGVVALIRASWDAAASYRVGLAFSSLSLLAAFVPLFFVSRALQPMMASRIVSEGDQYFAFVLLGFVCLAIITASLTAVPTAITAGLTTGTLEALFSTPLSAGSIITGISGYSVLWALVRGLLVIVIGSLVGAHIHWLRAPAGLLVIFMLIASYAGMGLSIAALTLAFRSSGPLMQGIVLASTLLGGVYYPTTVIPAWIRSLSAFVPLTYGLRALRRILLEDEPWRLVTSDVAVLFLFSAALVLTGWILFRAALEYARRAGSLGQY